MLNLEETLIELLDFHSICLKIGVKLKITTLWRRNNLAFEQ